MASRSLIAPSTNPLLERALRDGPKRPESQPGRAQNSPPPAAIRASAPGE